ncbi:MAG: FAD-binding oxidoreductase [Candidatus Methylomirabilota bacterium]
MTVATGITDGLRAIVGADHVLTGDGLPRYRLGTATAEAGVLPGDESEVSQVLRLAWEEGLAVVPWGGGTHQSIGYRPLRYDLALDLRRLNRLLEHEPADMTATAQVGIRMADLQRRLGDHGQFLPLEAAGAEDASLGGTLATRLTGTLRCRYGTARDLVLGVRVAHADGTITKAGAKVVKNATGYDVTKLYLGSHGTLGIILEATFRVYPRPAAEKAWWLPVADLETGQALASRILTSHLVPNRVELLDARAGRLCRSLTHGPSLLASISGIPKALQAQAGDMARLAEASGSGLREIPDPEQTWAAVGDFPWLTQGSGGAALRATWRGGVPPADCARGMRAVQEATRPWAEAAIAASVAHGALRGQFRAETAEALTRCLTASRAALTALEGYLVVLDAPEAVRHHVDVWGPLPDGFGAMKRLKAEFDPKGILNPGRFVGGI